MMKLLRLLALFSEKDILVNKAHKDGTIPLFFHSQMTKIDSATSLLIKSCVPSRRLVQPCVAPCRT